MFPVRGYSFLPNDRMFGEIEKAVRREEAIVNSAVYHQMFKENSDVVMRVNENWHTCDWKCVRRHLHTSAICKMQNA